MTAPRSTRSCAIFSSRRRGVASSRGTSDCAGIGRRRRGHGDQTEPLKKAVKYGMIQAGNSVKEKFQLLKELGFDGVELDSPSKLDPNEVLRARDEVGLPIHGVVDSVHWRDTLSHPDPAVRQRGLEGLQTALRDAKLYGGNDRAAGAGRGE